MLYIGADLQNHVNLITDLGIPVTVNHHLSWTPSETTLYDSIAQAEKEYKISCISDHYFEATFNFGKNYFDIMGKTLQLCVSELDQAYHAEIEKIITTILNLSEIDKLYEISLIEDKGPNEPLFISTIVFSSVKRKSLGPLSYGDPYFTCKSRRSKILAQTIISNDIDWLA
jgi:hypothetical protein